MCADYICIRNPMYPKNRFRVHIRADVYPKSCFGVHIQASEYPKSCSFTTGREEFQLVSSTNHFTSRSIEFYL